MRVFKPTYLDRKKKTRRARRWYVELRDASGAVRRLPGFTDKGATAALGHGLERLVAVRSLRQAPDPELARWTQGLPRPLLATLVRVGIIDPIRVLPSAPVSELLEDFERTLHARSRTKKHVDHVTGRARRAFEACGFRTWADVAAPELERFLHERREKGLSAKASNHILASCKQFTRWAVEQGLQVSDPLATARPVNARVDPRRRRRALTHEELRSLILAAQSGPEVRGVPGTVRAWTYRLAAETGFRANELQCLRVSDFHLPGPQPSVSLPASATKNRQEARLPLRADTARELGDLFREKLPSASALPLPHWFKDKATSWLKADLKLAKIPYKTEDGVADFHALRGAFVTGLVRSGANPRLVQTLARHSTAALSIGVYTKLRSDDERRAIESLPSLAQGSGAKAPAKATGTDGSGVLASGLASDPAAECSSMPLDAPSPQRGDPVKAAARPEVVEAAGIEPASRSHPRPSVYARVPRIGSRSDGARGRAPDEPASLGSRR